MGGLHCKSCTSHYLLASIIAIMLANIWNEAVSELMLAKLYPQYLLPKRKQNSHQQLKTSLLKGLCCLQEYMKHNEMNFSTKSSGFFVKTAPSGEVCVCGGRVAVTTVWLRLVFNHVILNAA